jgi:large subunit ribosomal protein L31
MKKNKHPKTHLNTKVTDLSTGESFVLASTKEEIVVEVTNLSHPFYTGKQKIVDTENLVKKFEERKKQVDKNKILSKREKIKARSVKTTALKANKTLTLKDMLKQTK